MKAISGLFADLIGVTGMEFLAEKARIQTSRMARATQTTGTRHHGSPVFRIDWRALERNKYAPWGRGDAAKAR